ncbi:hypothetical protein ZEAMMB73_Zm00001d036205 [Zea mays]|uniref:Uncharacterized protein n=1 Tax=Zea mays TaxID=4577 RepID=A0A1D6LL72_MAIZE|nr:hypothetical protein ZEAMMB73_Zm00001d036205 [Zea mays]
MPGFTVAQALEASTGGDTVTLPPFDIIAPPPDHRRFVETPRPCLLHQRFGEAMPPSITPPLSSSPPPASSPSTTSTSLRGLATKAEVVEIDLTEEDTSSLAHAPRCRPWTGREERKSIHPAVGCNENLGLLEPGVFVANLRVRYGFRQLDREEGDVLSTIHAQVPNGIVLGDYVIEYGDDDNGEDYEVFRGVRTNWWSCIFYKAFSRSLRSRRRARERRGSGRRIGNQANLENFNIEVPTQSVELRENRFDEIDDEYIVTGALVYID